MVAVCRTAQTVSAITTRKALAFSFAPLNEALFIIDYNKEMAFKAAL